MTVDESGETADEFLARIERQRRKEKRELQEILNTLGRGEDRD